MFRSFQRCHFQICWTFTHNLGLNEFQSPTAQDAAYSYDGIFGRTVSCHFSWAGCDLSQVLRLTSIKWLVGFGWRKSPMPPNL